MKRTCISHKDAEYICVSPNCNINCSYVCSTLSDKCKIDHESCQLMSIQSLYKQASNIVRK